MFRTLPPAIALLLVALTLGLVAPGASDAEAGGTWVPVFEEEVVCSVNVGDSIYVALPHQAQDLAETYGETPTTSTFGEVILNAPSATSSTEIVMHGCKAAGNAVTSLENKGYDTATAQISSFPGVSDDMVYTD